MGLTNFKYFFGKKLTKIFLFLLVLGGILFYFKSAILLAAGNYLIHEDSERYASHTFVLGGNSYDRGMKALDLFSRKLTDTIVCSGGNIPSVLAAIDTSLYEAQITQTLLRNNGVPVRQVCALTSSTSTAEESDEILAYCINNQISEATILSSKFHLRRVRSVFEKKFETEGIRLIFIGAPASNYEEATWWQSEAGMIMVNNEYMKLMYYTIR